MSENNDCRFGILDVDDSDVKYMTLNFSNTGGYEQLTGMVSRENGLVSFKSLGKFTDGDSNIGLLFNSSHLDDDSDYNLSISMFPYFGRLAFIKFDIDDNNEVTVGDLTTNDQVTLTAKITDLKRSDDQTGKSKFMSDYINKYGKRHYIDRNFTEVHKREKNK